MKTSRASVRGGGGRRTLADTAISFDFDGVLVRSPFGAGVLFPVLKELARSWAARTGAAPEAAERRLQERAWAEFRDRTARGDVVGAYDWQGIVEAVARSVGERFDGSLADMTRAFGERLALSGDRSLVYPRAHEVLAALRARGACLLLLTNGFREYQLPMARALGLESCFHAIVASDDLGTVKPRPEAFERAFGMCPAARSARRFHVGDTLSHDVAGARACGIVAVWIDWDLPQELAGLGPFERVRSPALQPVLRARLDRELSREAPHGHERPHLVSVLPDAAIRSLEELETVLDAGEAN